MKEVLACFFRRKRIFLTFFLSMVGGSMLLAYALPPKYEATAMLLLEPGRYKKPFLPNEPDSRTSLLQVSMEDVGSEVEILLSRPVLEVVVDRNGLDTEEPPPASELTKWAAYWTIVGLQKTLVFVGLKPRVPAREDAIERLHEKVDVEYIKRTNIIVVKWRGSTPELAKRVVDTLVDAYLQHHVRVHGNSSALVAMRQQLETSQRKLKEMEDALGHYQKAKNIGDLEAQHKDLVTKLTEAESRYTVLETVGEKGLTTSDLSRLDNDPAFAGLWVRLNEMELNRIDLISRYGPRERRVIIQDQGIGRLRKLIRDRFSRNLSSVREQVRLYRMRLVDLDRSKLEIQRLRRELQGFEQVYLLNREKFNEGAISNAMDEATIGSVRVVEYADISSAPAFPKRLIILVVSILLGTIGGLATAVSFDRLSNRVISVADVEAAVNAPLLASVRECPRGERGGTAHMLAGLSRDLVPIRAALLNGGQPRSMLLVSPSRKAGATFLAEQLARLVAADGRTRAVLVSFRYPDPAASAESGTATLSCLVGSSSLPVTRSDSDGAFRLVVDISSEESPMAGADFRTLFEKLKAEFAFVFVDAPTDRGDTFYLQIVPYVDQVVPVAGYDLTNRYSLARMVELVRQYQGCVTGCILNRRRDVIPEAILSRLF